MKILGKILVLVVSMLFGHCLMTGALAIHPFLGGMVLGITISIFLYMIHNITKHSL